MSWLKIFRSHGKQGHKAHVFHIHDDDGSDGVVCSAVRVVIKRDNEFWYAQGVEIDYLAQGNSLDEVKERFKKGLIATIRTHIKKFGSVQKLLRWAPESEWKAELNNTGYPLTFVEVFDEDKTDIRQQLADAFPFGCLAFIEPQSKHA